MAVVDASPRPEHMDPNPESGNASSTPQQDSSSAAENHNPGSVHNPCPTFNPHPSTPVQACTPPIAAPTFSSPFAHIGAPQFAGVPNPNPSFQMSAALQPPGVGPPGIVGSAAASPASPMMRPVGMYQPVPGQHPVQLQYGQVQNGYMAAGAIPPPGVPRFPGQFAGLIRPGFAPRPIPQIMRPNMAGIRPGPAPPIMAPLLRPVNPVPLVEKPQTTVYVGKIAQTVDNDFLLSLLKLCGPVKSWKRAQDPSDGKPKGFGFCEFEGAEGILRALRLLSKLNLDSQELVLNINQATREYLEKYVEKKTEREKFKETESLLENGDPAQSQPEAPKSTEEESKKESEDSSKDSSDNNKEGDKFGIVSDEDRKADKEAVEKIESMLEERAKILPLPPPLPPPNADSASSVRTEIPSRVKDDWDTDQIRSGEKNSEGDVSESNKGGNEVEASSGRSRRERSRERERERSNRDKEREREKEREADRYERDRERDRMKREREREDRVRQSDRQLKDRLKDWENREREREYQRHHERDREKERERERKREVAKQEDESEDEGNYNNERDRKRRRRGGNSNIEERKRKRQREKEEDVSDRLKEEEEAEEEMRRERELEKERLLREEQVEKEKELEKEKEEQLKREIYVKDVWNEMYGPAKEERESVEPMQVDLDSNSNNSNTDNNNNSNNVETTELGQETLDSKLNNNNGQPKKLGFGLFGSGKRASVPSVFQQEEDTEQEDKKMRPLVPIDYSAGELQAVSQTDSNEEAAQMNNISAAKRMSSGGKEKKKGETKKVLDAKQLIDMIPKTKEELFSYPINWTVYDKHGLNERMRPWISKKITEFLGEEEETLVDYIVSCTRDHVEASKLLELLQAILDEEAEMFVLKMWRMLIFEIKKVETGIAKGK